MPASATNITLLSFLQFARKAEGRGAGNNALEHAIQNVKPKRKVFNFTMQVGCLREAALATQPSASLGLQRREGAKVTVQVPCRRKQATLGVTNHGVQQVNSSLPSAAASVLHCGRHVTLSAEQPTGKRSV